MKTAKLELNSLEAAGLYRGLGAYERELKAETDITEGERIMSLAAIEKLKDKVAFIFERTRPAPDNISKVARAKAK